MCRDSKNSNVDEAMLVHAKIVPKNQNTERRSSSSGKSTFFKDLYSKGSRRRVVSHASVTAEAMDDD